MLDMLFARAPLVNLRRKSSPLSIKGLSVQGRRVSAAASVHYMSHKAGDNLLAGARAGM